MNSSPKIEGDSHNLGKGFWDVGKYTTHRLGIVNSSPSPDIVALKKCNYKIRGGKHARKYTARSLLIRN